MTLNQKILSGMAATALISAPAVAEVPRATAPVSETNEIGGEGGGWIAIAGVIAVVILAVIAASDGDDDPVSA